MLLRFVLLPMLFYCGMAASAQSFEGISGNLSSVSDNAYNRLKIVKAEEKSLRKVKNVSGDLLLWSDTSADVPFRDHAKDASEIAAYLLGEHFKEMELVSAVMRYHEPVLKNQLIAARQNPHFMVLPFVYTAGITGFSEKGAAGPWRLYFPHARSQGLLVSARVDERLDFEAASRAGIGLLMDMQKKNIPQEEMVKTMACGPLYRNLGDSILKKWCESIPAQVLAFVYIFENRERLGLDGKNAIPIPSDQVQVREKVAIKTLSHVLALEEKKIMQLNETILSESVPANYTLHLPANFREKFLLLEDSLYRYVEAQPVAEAPKIVVHIVRSGDTLGEIAQKYRVPVSALRSRNKIKGDMIYIGQKIIIP